MNQKYIDMIYSENHLEHHGVLGQKWGVENGPPYPLGRDVQSMLANGEFKALKYALKMSSSGKGTGYTKKDYKVDKKKIKEYEKEYRKTGTIKDLHDNKTNDNVSKEPVDVATGLKKLYSESTDKFNKECDRLIDKNASKEVINECVELYKDFIDSSNKYDPDDFYESEEFYRANEKAYDITKQIFKEDYPDEYKKMYDYSIKKYGDDSGFEDFHDFRKIYEGTQDDEWDKAEKEFFKNHPEYQEAREKEAIALEKFKETYKNEAKRISNSIVGDRGNEKLKNKYGNTGGTINSEIEKRLGQKILVKAGAVRIA